jgi:adenosine deaminase CECR1
MLVKEIRSYWLPFVLFVLLFFSSGAYSSAAIVTGLNADQKIDEKLSHYYRRYEKARLEALKKIKNKEYSIPRTEWEKMVTPAPEFQLSPQDLVLLKKRHQSIADRAQARAQSEYPNFNLDNLRRQPPQMAEEQAKKFCAALPKGGMLHVHILGTVDRATARELLETISQPISLKDIFSDGLSATERQELKTLVQSPPRAFTSMSKPDQEKFLDYFKLMTPFPKSFPRFQSVFHFILMLNQNPESVFTMIDKLANRAQSQNLIYLELQNWIDTTDRALVKKYEEAFQKAEKKYGIKIRMNVSFFRSLPADILYQQTQDFLKQKKSIYISGIDLVQNEDLPHVSALEKGLPTFGSVLFSDQKGEIHYHRAMHAGEMGDPRNPRDALILGAERLGHGVRLQEDEIALEYAARNKIPVEINLTSNFQLGPSSIQKHPYLYFLRLGLPVSLSTDDEGIFQTSINNECTQAVLKTSVEYSELKAMSFNSIQTSFAESDVKTELLRQLGTQFLTFEKTYKWSP